MRRIDKIALKIWLSLSILICGYFISMMVGFFLGRSAELRLRTVSDSLFPAAKQSQLAQVAFNEQIENFNDGVLLGEDSFIASARKKSREVITHLDGIISLPGISDHQRRRTVELQAILDVFNKEAFPVYSDLSAYVDYASTADAEDVAREKKDIEDKAFDLARKTAYLGAELETFSGELSDALKQEIAAINKQTLHQRYLNLIIFVIVVMVSVVLIVIIVVRSISRPLRRTFMLEKAVEQSDDGILVSNLEGRIQFVNRAWAMMHGYFQQELIGEPIQCFHSEEQNEKDLGPFLEKVREHGAHSGEVRHRRKNGDEFISMTTMTLLVESDDDDTRIISIARDITSLKQSEQELRRAKDETEEANLALHESLAVLKETQEQLIQSEKLASLGSLVAGVSHEINTPLGVGVTASSFLEERTQVMTASRKAGTLSNDSVDKYLNIAAEASSIILNNLNRAANLVRSFKQVAVDQSGETRRRFNFKEYLDELLISLRPKYRRTTHQVTVDCPEHIELDSYPGVFSQIVTNLLINSLRHGLEGIEGGKIHIAIEVHNDILRMVHSDNGRGMDEETRKQVFDPFFTTRRGAGGSGLGLNIVYNLVTRTLGGGIVCQSTPGKGSAFIMSLPINRGAVNRERALQSGSQSSDPPSSK